MKKLITIQKSTIGNNEINSVSARELYLGLGLSKDQWARWATANIEQNEFFLQGIDFIQLDIKSSASSPNPPKDYAISIDFAKHISMMAKTSKGHEYRNYFLELESSQSSLLTKEKVNLSVIAREFKGALLLAKSFGLVGNQALLSANKVVEQETGFNCQKALGLDLISPKKEHAITPSDIGVRLGGLSGMKVNQLLKNAGLQVDNRTAKNAIYWTPTEKGLDYAEVTQTNKKHSDGTPVEQVKWFESVIELIAV